MPEESPGTPVPDENAPQEGAPENNQDEVVEEDLPEETPPQPQEKEPFNPLRLGLTVFAALAFSVAIPSLLMDHPFQSFVGWTCVSLGLAAGLLFGLVFRK